MKIVSRRVFGAAFWGPWGGLDLPFEALWVPSRSHLGPQCPPGRFWRISGVIWESILSSKSMKFGVDFRCVFGMLFGGVLEWFWGCFGWLFGTKTTIKSKRVDLWKCLFYLRNINVFNQKWLQNDTTNDPRNYLLGWLLGTKTMMKRKRGDLWKY